MGELVDYSFYLSDYLDGREPVIPRADFEFWVRSAAAHITMYLGSPVTGSIEKNAKLCCCEAAELLWRYDHAAAPGVSSERTGDLSVSYESEEQRAKSLTRELRSCVYRYFFDSGLLYRGL